MNNAVINIAYGKLFVFTDIFCFISVKWPASFTSTVIFNRANWAIADNNSFWSSWLSHDALHGLFFNCCLTTSSCLDYWIMTKVFHNVSSKFVPWWPVRVFLVHKKVGTLRSTSHTCWMVFFPCLSNLAPTEAPRATTSLYSFQLGIPSLCVWHTFGHDT